MFRFIFAVVFLFVTGGCFSEINKAREQDGGVNVEDGNLPADTHVRQQDAEVLDAGHETPDVTVQADVAPVESDTQAPNPDATTPPVDASPELDVQLADAAEVNPDLGDIPDASLTVDAAPPVPDAAPACSRDPDCRAGQLCLDGQCQPEGDLLVWCWDHNPPDGRPTCHNVAGYSSPEVWRLGEYPNQPPACQGPTQDHLPVAECCRGSATWATEGSGDFRVCQQQPDGGPSTWNPYNN